MSEAATPAAPAEPTEPTEPGFSTVDGGARWRYAGPLRFENAETVLEAAQTLALPSSGVVDLAALDPADSAALAVLLALRRRARAEGRDLAFVSMPPTLASLARVYGIDTLLGGGG